VMRSRRTLKAWLQVAAPASLPMVLSASTPDQQLCAVRGVAEAGSSQPVVPLLPSWARLAAPLSGPTEGVICGGLA